MCLNCIEFCNMEAVTGVRNNETDLTMDQVDHFIRDVKALKTTPGELPAVHTIFLTGGEPTLHPHCGEIFHLIKRELVDQGFVGSVKLSSNLAARKKIPPELQPHVVNFVPVDQKAEEHDVTLLHPLDMRKKPMSFQKCSHFRKNTVAVSCHGYFLCCAGDGYARLFGMDYLFLDHLPKDRTGFPIDRLDDVCKHCPFPFNSSFPERKHGRPVSKIYSEQAELNRRGRTIPKKL